MTTQSGLCRTWSETPKTGFLTSRLILSCLFSPVIRTPIQQYFWASKSKSKRFLKSEKKKLKECYRFFLCCQNSAFCCKDSTMSLISKSKVLRLHLQMLYRFSYNRAHYDGIIQNFLLLCPLWNQLTRHLNFSFERSRKQDVSSEYHEELS